jgi:hypothetical protein
MAVFDGLRSGLFKDRSQFYKDLAIQFYGANRPGAEVSQGVPTPTCSPGANQMSPLPTGSPY